MAEGTRDLAVRLAALSDAELADFLRERRAPALPAWRDFFDAAEALTDPASLRRALATLPAADLAELTDAAREGRESGSAHTRRLMLTDAEGVPLPQVAALLAEFGGSPIDVGRPAPDADATAEGHAAERAFTSVAALGDILIQAIRTPLSRVGSGALGAADRRRLAEDLPHPDDVDPLISLAERAGLLAADTRSFMPTAAADDWLAASTPDRWTSAARAWWIAVPAPLTASARLTDPAGWPAAFPADPAWPDRGAAFRREAEAWGIVTPTGAAPSWTRLIGADPAAAARELATLMPREVDRIYLQNDLTAISPGPLAPGLDVRLRRIAVRESHAQASSYRFTAETVAGALTEGENAETILAFLAELSLTGVPQPLDYLVRTTAERHGTVRVGDDPDAPADATRTRVWSSSPEALEPIAVDQSLRPLGLVRTADGSALTSRVARDTVLWALIDARYPAIAVDADGTMLRLRRHRVAVSPPATDDGETYGPIIRLLRGADEADADAAWLDRELEAAVRERSLVEIDVELPGGVARTFVLEASGMGGGRMRGRERGTDVERTLPVSSIRSIRRL
ncbi:helicase-associated domain-containing protein [Microbacterium limosum]|uniref:Helicase-associated domain-containing protein n=1 Tax=Microbacterium limosum TaxID=3079935 RepID=A0AAU0MFH3_9MICO|nr:helicase-associated domain-containing protein [Microbacterium sp. Y20]WOQ69061.1 helicase-associated domain-containing protein [Microbacterium sp. Y20]